MIIVKRYSEDPNAHWAEVERFRRKTFMEGNNSLSYEKYDPENPDIETWMCFKHTEEWQPYIKPNGKKRERFVKYDKLISISADLPEAVFLIIFAEVIPLKVQSHLRSIVAFLSPSNFKPVV